MVWGIIWVSVKKTQIPLLFAVRPNSQYPTQIFFHKKRTKSKHSYQFVWIMLYDSYGSYHVVWISSYFIACYSYIRFFSLLNLFCYMFTSGKMEIKIYISISKAAPFVQQFTCRKIKLTEVWKNNFFLCGHQIEKIPNKIQIYLVEHGRINPEAS